MPEGAVIAHETERLVSPQELAKLLGVGRTTIYRLAEQGKFRRSRWRRACGLMCRRSRRRCSGISSPTSDARLGGGRVSLRRCRREPV
jgi:excisionase family DNA binding protein